jgi:DNA-binding transcriptional regulator/RsmH inhibitor MraZ
MSVEAGRVVEMTSIDTNVPVCYFACHRRNLDDKRRLQIPAKWYRKSDDGKILAIPLALILWPYDGQPDVFIQALPPEKFQVLWSKVTAVRFGDVEGQALKRTLAEKMEQVELDGSGRITLPDWMAGAAGLAVGQEVILNGMFDCFQIWSPERYEATRASVAAKAPNAFREI